MPRKRSRTKRILAAAALLAAVLAPGLGYSDEPRASQPTVRQHAEDAFHGLEQQRSQAASGATDSDSGAAESRQRQADIQSDADSGTLVGHGQGDLSKGRLVCQRVAELAARADIAKQIRVLVKEHATDRVRERTGREPEQDIEVVREEVVQEYLRGVKIVDLRFAPETSTCSATAIMRNRPIVASPSPQSEPTAVTPR